MRTHLAKLAGKLISHTTRTLKIGGGSAAPGLYALKIDPNLVEKLAKKIPKNIFITGTNGKTTTSRLLSHFLEKSGYKVIRNSTGSNLERGIASALIHGGDLAKYNFGVWELDEAAFNIVAPKIKPDIVVFLNVFRDQLDRYGEIDSVVKKWAETLEKLPKDTLILVNGDDVNTSLLKAKNVYRFGLKDHKITGEGQAKNLPAGRPGLKLDLEAKNIDLHGLEESTFTLMLHNKPYPVKLPLPGIYHLYDFLGAFYAGHELGLSTENMLSSLEGFQPAFGRVEKLPFGYIFLIKNPAGATQVFETLVPQIKAEDRILLALNDNLADGTDVSWIWDAEFETLRGSTPKNEVRKALGVKPLFFVTGTRAYDMAVRLKYAGFDTKQIKVESSLEKALREARAGLKGQLYILPTYTAMLELQAVLTKEGLKKNYWEEK
jgi:lipid II isoglutaminyl synthase (glutamine-hydrolysing)